MATISINVRIDEDLKRNLETILEDMGLNMSMAFNIFGRTVVREGKIPFEITSNILHIPNDETKAAIQEIRDMQSGKIPEIVTTVEDFIKEMEE